VGGLKLTIAEIIKEIMDFSAFTVLNVESDEGSLNEGHDFF